MHIRVRDMLRLWSIQDLTQVLRNRRHTVLLVAFITLVLLTPFLPPGQPGRVFAPLLIAAVCFFVLFGVGNNRRYVTTALTIIVIAYAAQYLFFLSENPSFAIVVNLLYIFFLFFVGMILFMSLLKSSQITMDTVDRAIVVWFLIGLLWAILYFLVSIFDPSALYINPGFDSPRTSTALDFLYFSYFTLAGITFGDIVPVSKVALTLVVFETVIGTFYIAIVIAKLIGGLRWGSD